MNGASQLDGANKDCINSDDENKNNAMVFAKL
jgi:hypothetical protein